jgi:hypothetical protein
MCAIIIFTFLKNAITIQLTMSASLQFRTCLNNAIMYAPRRPWPTCRRIGGGLYIRMDMIALANSTSLISLTCGTHDSGSPSTFRCLSPSYLAEPTSGGDKCGATCAEELPRSPGGGLPPASGGAPRTTARAAGRRPRRATILLRPAICRAVACLLYPCRSSCAGQGISSSRPGDLQQPARPSPFSLFCIDPRQRSSPATLAELFLLDPGLELKDGRQVRRWRDWPPAAAPAFGMPAEELEDGPRVVWRVREESGSEQGREGVAASMARWPREQRWGRLKKALMCGTRTSVK